MYNDEIVRELEALAAANGFELVVETEELCDLIPYEKGVRRWRNIKILDALKMLRTM